METIVHWSLYTLRDLLPILAVLVANVLVEEAIATVVMLTVVVVWVIVKVVCSVEACDDYHLQTIFPRHVLEIVHYDQYQRSVNMLLWPYLGHILYRNTQCRCVAAFYTHCYCI